MLFFVVLQNICVRPIKICHNVSSKYISNFFISSATFSMMYALPSPYKHWLNYFYRVKPLLSDKIYLMTIYIKVVFISLVIDADKH